MIRPRIGSRVYVHVCRSWGRIIYTVPVGWSDWLYRVRLDDNNERLCQRHEIQAAEELAPQTVQIRPILGAPAHILGIVIGGRNV